MKKVIALALTSFILTFSVPGFAKKDGGFVRDENFCFEIAQLARNCFDAGVSKGCETMPLVVHAIKNEFMKKYKDPRVRDYFEIFGNLCISMCADGEKFREDIKRENFTDYRDFVLAVAYNACKCDKNR